MQDGTCVSRRKLLQGIIATGTIAAWGDVGDSVPAVRYCIVSAVLIASGCATREFGTAGVMYVGQEHLNVAK